MSSTEGSGDWALDRGKHRSLLEMVAVTATRFARLPAEGEAAAAAARGWVVLGDSTAQAIGADRPDAGYVGQVRRALEARDGRPWRVVNLSCSGAMARDLLTEQLPALARLGQAADLVTC